MRREECEGSKGMAEGIKPVDLEWPFSHYLLVSK